MTLQNAFLRLILLGAVLHSTAAFAQSFPAQNEPLALPIKAASVFTRSMDLVGPNVSERSTMVRGRGTRLRLIYRSTEEVEVIVSYPSGIGPAGARWNPLDDLRATLPAPGHQDVFIDLTISPAWLPSRTEYILTLRAHEGTDVTIDDAHIEGTASIRETVGIALRHILIDEPPLPSSIVFLYGYHVLGRSVTLVLGSIFLVIGLCIVARRHRSFLPSFAILCLVMLLLYDARSAVYVVRVTAQDVIEQQDGMYRQLGFLPTIATFLQEEAKNNPSSMHVSVCSDEQHLLFRWLRYALYPIDVRMAEDGWQDATHVVIISSTKSKIDHDGIHCDALIPRSAEILRKFDDGTLLLHVTSP